MTYGLKEAHDELLSELEDLRAKYNEICETSAMLRADMAYGRKLREKLMEEAAENKWAREFLNSIAKKLMLANAHSLANYVETIEDQNAKLRELVRDMWECISHANGQDWFYFEHGETGCGMSCVVNGEGCGLLVLADRMRELGIEVDG